MGDLEAIARWLVALTLVSAALAPAVWWLADGLEDAGYGLTRALAPFLAIALLWWPAALLGVPFTRLMLLAVVLIAGAAGWTLWLRAGRSFRWRPVVAFELIWLVLFGGYALFRSYHPDIANTEKPMEIALLSSISRSADVPAPDPWFAGETINYYYFGYQVVAGLVKLSGVPPSIAFNLTLATLFASLGTAVVALGWQLARRAGIGRRGACVTAALAGFFVLLAGNLETARRMVRDPVATASYGWWYDGVGWQASRIIVDHGVRGNPGPRTTINEFPAFSFILGDLHPHVLTYPFLASILALVAGLALTPSTATTLRIAAIGALCGLLYASNSWDAPLGFALLTGTVLLALSWRQRRTWLALGSAAVAALIAALPFIIHFTAPVGVSQAELPGWVRGLPLINRVVETLGVVTWQPSGWGELLLVHGAWIAAFALFAVFVGASAPDMLETLQKRLPLLIATAMVMLLIAVVRVPAIALIGVPLAGSLIILAQATDRAVRLVAGLFAVGFGLILVPEFVYIQDAFGDRMNTVFKLYFQAWLILGIASGVALALALRSRSTLVARVSVVSGALIVVAVLPYSPISARDWTADFERRWGLDGAAYIGRAAPAESAAIEWLGREAGEGAVIVEGPGCSYGTVGGVPMNRFSAFTGVPALVGWDGHQRQWRRGEQDPIGPRVGARQATANEWLSGNVANLAGFPEPDYIILGLQEQRGSDSCDPLVAHDVDASQVTLEAQGWQTVFTAGEVTVLGRE